MAGLGGLKKQRRIRIIVLAMVALVVATVLVGYAMRDGINYFRAPAQVVSDPPAPGEMFRLGGLVLDGSYDKGKGSPIEFIMTDGKADVPVRFNGIPPDLFDNGSGAVALGQMQDGTFVATEILAKHDETYMPKELIDALKEQGVYKADGEKIDPGAQTGG